MKASFPKWRVNGNENLVKLCTNFEGFPEAIDLLTQMMQLEPSKRITVKGALAHPFFKEYHNNQNQLYYNPSASQDYEMQDDCENGQA
jgi:serine/threonine protein kinase